MSPRDENMAKVITQLDLLIKHIMGSTPKAVNSIGSKKTKAYEYGEEKMIDREIWFLSNQIGCSQATYQRQGKNKGLKERNLD